MTCKAILQEFNSQRKCWLPKDRDSPFDLCSRCDYYRVEQILSTILQGDFTGVSHLSNPQVVALCLKPTHRDSLLAVLSQETNSTLLPLYLKDSEFEQTLKNQCHIHTPSNRCSLYQQYLRERSRDTPTDLPANCWGCMAFILRQKDMLGFYEVFAIAMTTHRLRMPIQEQDRKHLVQSLISLELAGKPHLVRTTFNTYRLHVSKAIAKQTLIDFFSQPATVSLLFLFTEKAQQYIPYSLLNSEQGFLQTLQKEALLAIRNRNWVFKEELTMKTWAPHRLFSWCFDIEELNDFDVS